MKRGLFWKVKVASIVYAFGLLLPILALAQQQYPRALTLQCENSTFAELVDRLSITTGFNFIYSSNNIDILRTYSLSVEGSTAEELLSKLGKTLGISFTIDNRHVIIKQDVVDKNTFPIKANDSQNPVAESEPVKQPPTRVKAESLGKDSPRQPLEYYLSYPQLEEHLPSGSFNYPPVYREKREWLKKVNLGLSLLTSDIGTGVEISPGFGPMILLVQPAWHHNDGFVMSYGAGVNLPELLGFHLTVNYLYSGLNFQEPFLLEEFGSTPASMSAASRMELMQQHNDVGGTVDMGKYSPRSSVNIHRHQANLLFNYQFSEKVKLQLGPTFNYAMTTKWVDNWQAVFTSSGDYVQSSRRGGYPAPLPAFPNHEQQGIRDFASSFEREKVSNFWIGWRAGIIYRLDLFR